MMEKRLLRDLKGVGEKTEKLFLKLNLRTTEDLLSYYPHRYDIYEPAVAVRDLRENEVQAVSGVISQNLSQTRTRNLTILTTTVVSEGEKLSLTWFHAPYLRSVLKRLYVYLLFRGKVIRKEEGCAWNIRRFSLRQAMRRFFTGCSRCTGLRSA